LGSRASKQMTGSDAVSSLLPPAFNISSMDFAERSSWTRCSSPEVNMSKASNLESRICSMRFESSFVWNAPSSSSWLRLFRERRSLEKPSEIRGRQSETWKPSQWRVSECCLVPSSSPSQKKRAREIFESLHSPSFVQSLSSSRIKVNIWRVW
jgi:hypothetical protein